MESKLINTTKEVFIVDSWPDEIFYDLYVSSIPQSVPVKILTLHHTPKFLAIGRLFKNTRNIEIRESNLVHDRYVIIDDDAWMLGASIKDAGKRPTTITKVHDKDKLYNIWKPIFDQAKVLV